jgi:hypothetical protein
MSRTAISKCHLKTKLFVKTRYCHQPVRVGDSFTFMAYNYAAKEAKREEKEHKSIALCNFCLVFQQI